MSVMKTIHSATAYSRYQKHVKRYGLDDVRYDNLCVDVENKRKERELIEMETQKFLKSGKRVTNFEAQRQPYTKDERKYLKYDRNIVKLKGELI